MCRRPSSRTDGNGVHQGGADGTRDHEGGAESHGGAGRAGEQIGVVGAGEHGGAGGAGNHQGQTETWSTESLLVALMAVTGSSESSEL